MIRYCDIFCHVSLLVHPCASGTSRESNERGKLQSHVQTNGEGTRTLLTNTSNRRSAPHPSSYRHRGSAKAGASPCTQVRIFPFPIHTSNRRVAPHPVFV